MSFSGFGLSPHDFVLLVQLARKTFRNSQQAGDEYAEIASEVRCLHSVLRTIRTLAERPDSNFFRQDRTTTAQLVNCADGCKHVLDDLDHMLAKYPTLNDEGQPSIGKKIWQRFRFGSKIQELGVVRGKLITYTSTMSILSDTMQNQALDRIETKIDDGFGEVKGELKGEFERMRREIYSMATQARAAETNGSTLSLLSLSTYSGDEKETWRAFRRELINKGFRSRSLDKYGHILQAYMLKLDQSGLLENARSQGSTSANARQWWSNRTFSETFLSFPHPSMTDIDEETSANLEDRLQSSVTFAPEAPPAFVQANTTSTTINRLHNPVHFVKPCKPGRTLPKVAFATTSASQGQSYGTRQATHSTKSILRHPTPKFPEDPNYVREGVGLPQRSLGDRVPEDARVTILDKRDFDITAIRWLVPRCEERQDHVVVFKVLDDKDIKVFSNLTATFRGMPTILYSFLRGLITCARLS
jgi:hypothetical protein